VWGTHLQRQRLNSKPSTTEFKGNIRRLDSKNND